MIECATLHGYTDVCVLFIHDLFNYDVSSSDSTAPKDKMKKLFRNWKQCERKLWRNLRYYPSICLKELRKAIKIQ
jgi:hypothetical protein